MDDSYVVVIFFSLLNTHEVFCLNAQKTLISFIDLSSWNKSCLPEIVIPESNCTEEMLISNISAQRPVGLHKVIMTHKTRITGLSLENNDPPRRTL